MRKKIIGLLLLMGLTVSIVTPAFAKTYTGNADWGVTFTSENKMESNFKTSNIDDVVRGMQPGDNAIITLKLQNKHSSTTDWYMTNKVIDSLEDGSSTASGGAYTYRLVYTDTKGNENVLFDSDTVGGDTISKAGEGLNEATNALQDYFYLDTLKTNEGGTIELEVALDGETQGNDYQDTLADLQMNFAVELTSAELDDTSAPVKTGDESNLGMYFAIAGVAGVILLIFAIVSMKRRKEQKGEGSV